MKKLHLFTQFFVIALLLSACADGIDAKMITQFKEKRTITKLSDKYGKNLLNIVKCHNGDKLIIRFHWDDFSGTVVLYLIADIIRIGKLLPLNYNLGIHVIREENSFWIGKIAIYNDEVNNGYGTILINELIEFAKTNGIKTISGHMSVGDSDEHFNRLNHFYSKLGFNVEGLNFSMDISE